ncbi:hypothetical protein V8F06_013987 [Rhypophila decipiens]
MSWLLTELFFANDGPAPSGPSTQKVGSQWGGRLTFAPTNHWPQRSWGTQAIRPGGAHQPRNPGQLRRTVEFWSPFRVGLKVSFRAWQLAGKHWPSWQGQQKNPSVQRLAGGPLTSMMRQMEASEGATIPKVDTGDAHCQSPLFCERAKLCADASWQFLDVPQDLPLEREGNLISSVCRRDGCIQGKRGDSFCFIFPLLSLGVPIASTSRDARHGISRLNLAVQRRTLVIWSRVSHLHCLPTFTLLFSVKGS